MFLVALIKIIPPDKLVTVFSYIATPAMNQSLCQTDLRQDHREQLRKLGILGSREAKPDSHHSSISASC